MSVGPDEFRLVLGRFASGVTVLTARDARGEDHGMTVSAFCSVSLEPPLVLACIAHSADMWRVLGTTDRFGISVLGAGQEAVSRRFAEVPSNRFDGVGYTRGDSGVALLDEAIAHLECHVVARHEAGDHTIVVGAVDAARPRDGQPLLYYRGGYTQMEH